MTVIGDRIKQLRERRQWTQADLAKHINVSQSSIAYYEIGKNRPGREVLTKLSECFGVSVDYLLGITDNEEGMSPEEIQQNIELDTLLKDKNIMYYGEPLSVQEKVAIMEMIKALRKAQDKKE